MCCLNNNLFFIFIYFFTFLFNFYFKFFTLNCYKLVLVLATVAHELAGGNPRIMQQWALYAPSCVQKTFTNFNSKFGDSQPPLNAFKASR